MTKKLNTGDFNKFSNRFRIEPVTQSEIFLITSIILIKALFTVLLLKEGFVGLFADDFTRQLIAYN